MEENKTETHPAAPEGFDLVPAGSWISKEEAEAREEDLRFTFELEQSGVRSAEAARAVMKQMDLRIPDRRGKIEALKAACPWLFGEKQGGLELRAQPQNGDDSLSDAAYYAAHAEKE